MERVEANLDLLHTKLDRHKRHVHPAPTCATSHASPASKFWANFLSRCDSFFTSETYSMLQSRVAALSTSACRSTSRTFQPEQCLQLPVPRESTCTTLINCFNELMNEREAIVKSCDVCGATHAFTKTTRLHRYPNVLFVGTESTMYILRIY